ncbi:MAG: hypothetical protein MUF15_08800 [Acidobacteria bacterium]|nr:hypothetical protein [Acidobacteriota bacterium]
MEFQYDYSEPFFEFFKVFQLEGLNEKETLELLLQLGKTYKVDTVDHITRHNPGRIETLRRLTNGVLRTIILLFEIFVDNENGNTFQDLEIILDRVTPLYKHRMEGLPPQKQEIVDVIALNWDAIGVKEISKKTRIPGKLISAQLNELEKNRIITKISTSTKNNLYQISERFFNIWYLMRNGRKRERQKILWLVRFLESWFSKEDLIQKTMLHIEAIKEGNILEKYAYYMTEALAATEIPRDIQDDMIKITKVYLSQKKSSLINELTASENELYSEAFFHLINREYKSALNKFLQIKNKHSLVYYILGNLFLHFNDFTEAEKYYRMAIDFEDRDILTNPNFLWETGKFEDIKKANKLYSLLFKEGVIWARLKLAQLYFYTKRNKKDTLELTEKIFDSEKDADTIGFYILILLWNNKIEEALNMFNLFIKKEGMNNDDKTPKILLLLLAKKQYHYVLKLFLENKFYIRDRYKPIYYALMVLMKETYPDESKKMGNELKQTVDEIIEKINQLEIDYA